MDRTEQTVNLPEMEQTLADAGMTPEDIAVFIKDASSGHYTMAK